MSEVKKYYWIKLQKDFFKRTDIRVIENMENGKDYMIFYLKLLLESIEHKGNLRVTDTIPYDDRMLSHITGVNIDIVRSAMKVFASFGMMKLLDDQTIFMTEIEKMTGHETEWARKKQKQREKKKLANAEKPKLGLKGDNVPKLSLKCPDNVRQEKEIEKEKELELDKELELELDKELELELDKELDKELERETDIDKRIKDIPLSHLKIIDLVIAHLNHMTNKNFRVTKVIKLIISERISEGATIREFRHVIDVKCSHWLGKGVYENNLNPKTLFSEANFNTYLNQDD